MALTRRDASHASPPSPWVHRVPAGVSALLDSEPCSSRRSPRKLKMSLVFCVFLIRERRRGFRDASRPLTATAPTSRNQSRASVVRTVYKGNKLSKLPDLQDFSSVDCL